MSWSGIVTQLPVTQTSLNGADIISANYIGLVQQPQITMEEYSPSYHIGMRDTNVISDPFDDSITHATIPYGILGRKLYTEPSDRFMNFGFIVSNASISFRIENYDFVDLEIAKFSYLSTLGIEVHDVSVGAVIPVNGGIDGRITALSSEGSAIAFGRFRVVFTDDTYVEYWIYIARASSFVYSMIPDLNTYSESITYRTEVVTYTNGKEARRSLMTEPKYMFEYQSTAYTDSLVRYGSNLFHFGYYNRMHQPLWFQHNKIGADLVDTNVIFIDTTGKDYEIGGHCVIISDPLYPIIMEITSVESDRITISYPLNLEAPFYVAPTVYCLQPNRNSYSMDSLRMGKYSFTLEEV